jgi:hypothetical protein
MSLGLTQFEGGSIEMMIVSMELITLSYRHGDRKESDAPMVLLLNGTAAIQRLSCILITILLSPRHDRPGILGRIMAEPNSWVHHDADLPIIILYVHFRHCFSGTSPEPR